MQVQYVLSFPQGEAVRVLGCWPAVLPGPVRHWPHCTSGLRTGCASLHPVACVHSLNTIDCKIIDIVQPL